jgi:hypothetical protein
MSEFLKLRGQIGEKLSFSDAGMSRRELCS